MKGIVKSSAVLSGQVKMLSGRGVKEEWIESLAGVMMEHIEDFQFACNRTAEILTDMFEIEDVTLLDITKTTVLRMLPVVFVNVPETEEAIEQVYEERKELYTKAYEESILSHEIATGFVSLSKIDLYRKVAGIVANGMQSGETVTINKIIRLSLPNMYRTMMKSRKEIDYSKYYGVRESFGKDRAYDSKLNYHGVGLIESHGKRFLSAFLAIQTNSPNKDLDEAINNILSFINTSIGMTTGTNIDNRFYTQSFDRDLQEEEAEIMTPKERTAYFKNDKVLSIYFDELKGMVLPKEFENNLNNEPFIFEDRTIATFLDICLESEFYNRYYDGKLVDSSQETDPIKEEKLRKQIYRRKTDMYKSGGFPSEVITLSQFSKVVGVPDIATVNSLEFYDLVKIVDVYHHAKTVDKVNYTFKEFVPIALQILTLSKEMENLVELFNIVVEEEVTGRSNGVMRKLEVVKAEYNSLLVEYEKMKKQTKDLPKDWKKTQEELVNDKKSRDYIITEKNAELLKANEKMKEQELIIKRQQEELESLKKYQEFIQNSSENGSDEYETETIEASKEKIFEETKQNSIVFVGGHARWIQKMKRELGQNNKIEFIDISKGAGQLNKRRSTIYFVLPAYCNHKIFNELKSVVENDKAIKFLNNITNIEMSIHEVASQL